MNEENKVEIKSLKIKMGEKEVEISIEEARKLHEVLNELFKPLEVKEIVEHHYHDYTVPAYPPYYWYFDTNPSWVDGTTITCDTNTLHIETRDIFKTDVNDSLSINLSES